ncbi:hypothetical protein GCM10023156_61990 [Novipirellula rosea]|uniref:Response regulatory domain-containing protein n=2 Tax=Novipirellula rosea TaxID=1031540 RepID=A0ABP8NRI5_9BACT
MLSGDSREVLTASPVEEGLRMAAERKPDLVLLDVRVPKKDGISALPKFIEATRCFVIIMSTFGDLETAVSAVKHGASEYIIEPFTLHNAQVVCSNALRANGQPR